MYAPASAFRPDVTGLGYWVFTPARLADGSLVIVNRGFVPDGRKDPKSRPDGSDLRPYGDYRQLCAGRRGTIGSRRATTRRTTFGFPAIPSVDRDRQGFWAAVAPFYVEQELPVPLAACRCRASSRQTAR